MPRNKKIILTNFAFLILVLAIFPSFVNAVETYGSATYGSGIYGLAECGNSVCESTESCSSCSADCGSCPSEAAAPSGGGGSGGGGGGGQSDFRWECNDWSSCTPEGIQTRTCINIGASPGTFGKPQENQTCAYTQPISEEEVPSGEEIIPPPVEIPEPEKPAIYNATGLERIAGSAVSAIKKPDTLIGLGLAAIVIATLAVFAYRIFMAQIRKR